MSDHAPLDDIVLEADRLLEAAATADVPVRLVGGLAVRMHAGGEPVITPDVQGHRPRHAEGPREAGRLGVHDREGLRGRPAVQRHERPSPAALLRPPARPPGGRLRRRVRDVPLHPDHRADRAPPVGGAARRAPAHQDADRRAERQGPGRHPDDALPPRRRRGRRRRRRRERRTGRPALRRRLGPVADDQPERRAHARTRSSARASRPSSSRSSASASSGCGRGSSRSPSRPSGRCETGSATRCAGTRSPKRSTARRLSRASEARSRGRPDPPSIPGRGR